MPIRFPLPTRRWLPGAALLALAAIAPCPVRAQRPAPIKPDEVLAALKDLKTKQVQIIGKEKQGVLAAIDAAMADPVKAYEQAVVAVDIQGQGNEGTKLTDWRKKNAEMLRNPSFAIGVRLQLLYIRLTWQRSMGAKNKDLLPSLYEYVKQVAGAKEGFANFPPVMSSLNGSVFVKYFQIGPFIKSIKDWSDEPMDTDSIFQSAILPTLRDMKDSRVLDYWSDRIQVESARADHTTNGLALNKFNNVRLPSLAWSRAEDELLIGQRDQAITDMLAIAKAHPDHPEFDKWARQLTDLVTPIKAEVIVKDVPEGTAAPAASPVPATATAH